jgi:hypothetical protein
MKPNITNSLLDQRLKNDTQPSDPLGPDGLFAELKKSLINRILDSELTTPSRDGAMTSDCSPVARLGMTQIFTG